MATTALRGRRELLLNSICHCLDSVTGALFAECIIPQDVYDKACIESKESTERSGAVLDCIASRIEGTPSDFTKVVHIFNSDLFLQPVAKALINTYTNMSTGDCQPVYSSAIFQHRAYLKSVYNSSPVSLEGKWPSTPCREYIYLAVVEGQWCRDKYIGYTLKGDIKQILNDRKGISIEQIFEPKVGHDNVKLVLVEGAPGIGKSTLAWELCRKWEEVSCMKRYSLVILLRLREEEVQSIKKVSQLFEYTEIEEVESLIKEVMKNHGKGILFILDGFDELPKKLRQKSFLLNLIGGTVLPESSVLVTTRPSATGELLTRFSPRIVKHIEILGFTQESVDEYALSVFSTEPEELKKFKMYISASENPAINSLMYVPLNAAIIVHIFRARKSDRHLPHTLTEMYTQLCFTILNRYLKIHHPSMDVEQLKDLPPDLYADFLKLCEIAFNGTKNEEVIFHSQPKGIIHFGFLDAVSALYGGGSVSYNFLHLTLQEFFAAYHISRFDSVDKLKAVKKLMHGHRDHWNVVFRFVAGLTKGKDYEDYEEDVDVDMGAVVISDFLLQCSFEAQTANYWTSVLKSHDKLLASNSTGGATTMDKYILGYCIANTPAEFSWVVELYGGSMDDLVLRCFRHGLKTGAARTDVIKDLHVFNYQVNVAEFYSYPLEGTTTFSLVGCKLTDSDMTSLSELLPRMKCLSCLDISNTVFTSEGLLNVLLQLSHSNVSTLKLMETGFCKLLIESPHDYSSAMSKLIDPVNGILEELRVGDKKDYDDRGLSSVLSSHSSLKYLKLHNTHLKNHVSYLQNNTSLTKLSVENRHLNFSEQVPHIVKILQSNNKLQHLEIHFVKTRGDPNAVKGMQSFTEAVRLNSTLLTIEMKSRDFGETQYQELKLDPRIVKT